MKPGSRYDASGLNQQITETIENAFAAAGLSSGVRPAPGVLETIQRALASAGLAAAAAPAHAAPDITIVEVTRSAAPKPRESMFLSQLSGGTPARGEASVVAKPAARPAATAPSAKAVATKVGVPAAAFSGEFSNKAGKRDYKVHVPAHARGARLPLVVMLHGCTQSADDFAVGTRMNTLADEQGFMVLYPEQASAVNASKCWNWFSAEDQLRDRGEPSLIAGLTREVIARHGADPRRVFVAGMSAGAAMAVIMGETYPELYAAVGVHSGLPYGAAHDIASALSAMQGGRSGGRSAAHRTARAKPARAVPTIVFHGDRDRTVHPSNGVEILEQAGKAHAAADRGPAIRTDTSSGTAAGGRKYTRTVHAQPGGHALIESWTLHGGGHAWSGGDNGGSHTDSAGPDASAEMVRFFLAQPFSDRQ